MPTSSNTNKAGTTKQPRHEDSVKKPERKKMVLSASSVIKNNNPEWHWLNEETNCKICGLRVSKRFWVKHYVNSHPTNEVFPCRVAQNVAEALRDSKAVHQCKRDSLLGFIQICYFCNTVLSMRKHRWINHMAFHTGQYPFQCTDCFQKFLTKNACEGKCNVEAVIQPEFEAPFMEDNVIAYLCDLCNFVRFDKTGIENHLKSEHDGDGDVENNFKEVVFLSFPISNDETNGGTSNGEFIY